MHLSQRGSDMPASPIRRLAPLADEARARGIHVYPLNIGQPDIPTPREMMDAIRGFAEPVLAYGPSAGTPAARQAIASYLRRQGAPVGPEHVLVTEGGSEAILFALFALCDPGDEVVVFEPFYGNYSGFACMAGVRIVPVETTAEGGFRPPADEVIERAIGPRTRAILYSSPSNPTGTVLRGDEVARLVAIAKRRGIVLLADEAYREFVYDGARHAGVLEVASTMGGLDHVVLLDSISKRFSACGARIGYLATTSQPLLEACLRYGQARLCPPTIEQLAVVAAYASVDRTVPPMVEAYRRRRDLVMRAIEKIPGAVCAKPEGAFYVQPSLPIDDSDAFASFLLSTFEHEKRTVMVAPGTGFYATPGKGKREVRIAYVLAEHDLEAAMDLLIRGLAAYPGRLG